MNRDEVFRAEHFNAAEPGRALLETASHEPSVDKIIQNQDAHCAKEDMCFLREPKDIGLSPSSGVSVLGWDVLGFLQRAGSK